MASVTPHGDPCSTRRQARRTSSAAALPTRFGGRLICGKPCAARSGVPLTCRTSPMRPRRWRNSGPEHQRRVGVPAVLWLDLNSYDPMSENFLEQMDPLESTPIGLISGALWHAFYGWKGAPILEDWHRQVFTMAHDGRFRATGAGKSHLAAAIICIERGLVLYENSWADVRLPAAFRHRCQRLPWFKIAPSIVDWAPGGAAGRVALAEAQTEAIAATRRA